MNPFDYVNAINSHKDIVRESNNPELAEKLYHSFMVNRALSYHIDTILYANEMNLYSEIPAIMQNDYYLNSTRPKKRYAKWHKRLEDEAIEVIQEFYGVSMAKALDIYKVLTEDQIDAIKQKIFKGGNNVQYQSISRSKT